MHIRKGFPRFILLLSILVGITIPVCHEWVLHKSEVNVDLPENWQRMSIAEKSNSLEGLLAKNATFFPLSKIRQINIRRQLKKMILSKKDQVLRDGFKYSFSFLFDVGWEELTLLGLAGFASVWIIYVSLRGVILLIPSGPIIHFPCSTLRERVESLNFHAWFEPTCLPRVRITLFGFLALEEGSKRPTRPRKPRAVWID